jgi:hypothetical protein
VRVTNLTATYTLLHTSAKCLANAEDSYGMFGRVHLTPDIGSVGRSRSPVWESLDRGGRIDGAWVFDLEYWYGTGD